MNLSEMYQRADGFCAVFERELGETVGTDGAESRKKESTSSVRLDRWEVWGTRYDFLLYVEDFRGISGKMVDLLKMYLLPNRQLTDDPRLYFYLAWILGRTLMVDRQGACDPISSLKETIADYLEDNGVITGKMPASCVAIATIIYLISFGNVPDELKDQLCSEVAGPDASGNFSRVYKWPEGDELSRIFGIFNYWKRKKGGWRQL